MSSHRRAGSSQRRAGFHLDRIPLVCQSTPRCRAGPVPRRWCRRSQLPQDGADGTGDAVGGRCSLNLSAGRAGSRQRQIGTSHRSSVTLPKQGSETRTVVAYGLLLVVLRPLVASRPVKVRSERAMLQHEADIVMCKASVALPRYSPRPVLTPRTATATPRSEPSFP
jgi:hypothetical protein